MCYACKPYCNKCGHKSTDMELLRVKQCDSCGHYNLCNLSECSKCGSEIPSNTPVVSTPTTCQHTGNRCSVPCLLVMKKASQTKHCPWVNRLVRA
jgi:hypothetical protein